MVKHKFALVASSLLVILGGRAWGGELSPASSNSNTVAVVDFTMAGESPGPDNWAVGLADLFALELQEQTIPILERRHIRLVLGERQLAKMGISDWQRLAQQKLPQVQYLLSGEIRRIEGQNYHLSVALTAVRSGREAASFAQAGAYPGGLFAGLKNVAQKAAEQIRKGEPANKAESRVPAGFTRLPEVAWLFYRGVEHCLAGRPEYGVPCFLQAQSADPLFLAVKLWKLRAFQMLGVEEYVRACRDELLESAQGAAALASLDKAPFFKQDQLNLTLVADANRDQDLALLTAFRAEFQKQPGFRIFDPRRIDSLTSELDLQLSEHPDDPMDLASMAWTAVDEVLAFRVAAKDQGKPASAFIEGRDAVSGTVLFQTQAEATPVGMTLLSQVTGEQVRRRHQSADALDRNANPKSPAVKVTYDSLILPPNYWTNRDYIARLLQCTSQDPKDRRPILRLQVLFREGQPRLAQANTRRYIAAIDPADPQASTRLAYSLWHLRGIYSPLSAQEAFGPLLERYPNSLEADNVRSMQALEAFDRKDYARAAQLWTNLLERLPRQAPADLIPPAYSVSVRFFTAAALAELNRLEAADQYLRQAEALLKAHPEVTTTRMGIHGLSPDDRVQPQWINHFLEDHPYFGSEKTVRDAVVVLRRRLSSTEASPNNSAILAERLDQLLAEADASDGTNAATKDLAFVRQLIAHKQQFPKEYEGPVIASHPAYPMRQVKIGNWSAKWGNFSLPGKFLLAAMGKINQLMRVARDLEQRRQFELLATELAAGLDRTVAVQCYQAAGQYDQALALVEEELKGKRAQEAKLLKRWLLRATQGPAASGEYLLAEMAKSEAGYRSTLGHPAAIDLQAAGLYERASRVYEQIAAADLRSEPMKASFNYYRAQCEFHAGNVLAATELLRELMKTAEGKHWFLYDHTVAGNEPSDLYSLAADSLDRIRFLTKVQRRSFDWESKPGDGSFPIIPPPWPEPRSAIETDLNQILFLSSYRRSQDSYSQKLPTDDFRQKHGRAAVPALLRSLSQNAADRPVVFLLSGLVNQVATVEDAPAVLEAFRHVPELAVAAFRLDPNSARAITAERFPIFCKSIVPFEFNSVVVQYKIRETYPVLIASLAAKEFVSHLDVLTLDRILTNDPVPEAIEDFRQAFGRCLERILTSNLQYRNLGPLALIALKHGAPEGISALLRCPDTPKDKALAQLRQYIDLPADDVAALKQVEEHRGQYRWNAARRKYEVGHE
jgi:tetratricopeptide (TPR) repeat protein